VVLTWIKNGRRKVVLVLFDAGQMLGWHHPARIEPRRRDKQKAGAFGPGFCFA